MPLLPFGAKPSTNKPTEPTEPRLKAMSSSLYSIPGWQVYSVTTKSYGVGTGDTIFVPIYVGGRLSFNGLCVNVTKAGDPNQPVRLGLYNSRTVGNYILPGTVAVDAGMVAVGTTGIKIASVNLTLDKGYYFTVISISTGSTTGLTLRTINVASKTPVGGYIGSIGTGNYDICYLVQGVDHNNFYTNGYTDNPTISNSMRNMSYVHVWMRHVPD